MTSSGTKHVRLGNRIGILLFALAVSLLSAVPARAQSVGGCVANFGGLIDGRLNPNPPSQINIDGNCTIQNFPVSNPLTSNISFTGTGTGWLVIFNNVDYIGNISCDKSHGNFIWFVNGSITTVRQSCQNFFIPVEKIDKQNPAGQTTAAIGVPFTYSLTIPVMFDPGSGIVINSQGSPNDLHSITVTDDLNATGASLSYVSHVAYWKSTGAPVPHSFSNVGGVLTFSNFPILPAGQQIIIQITVVLNNDPANTPGKTFFNTATWVFGRLINGIFYQPLPGESGITPPMTIAAPNLTLTKTGPATMNPGQLGQFGLNVQNTGTSDAWNATLLDRLPTGATGGMCSTTPKVLSAQVFQADGVTPVAGKGPLAAGTDFSLGYNKPTCELTLTMLTAAATISQNQRLIINYQTQLDANSQNGATLTNVAGATQWFDGSSTTANRNTFTGPLTNGTPGILDNQDAHTVTVVVAGLAITKQVSVVGGGAAVPGGQLDYLVHVTNPTTNPATLVVITDDLSSAGAGRLTFVNPAATMNGATTGVTVAGSVLTADYSTSNGPLQPGQSIDVKFRVQIAAGLPAGTTLTNTGTVTWNTPQLSASASASIDIGGTPGSGMLNGTVWHDANFNKIIDTGEPLLQGWTVSLYHSGVLLQSAVTDVNGVYHFTGIAPTNGTDRYELRFTATGAGANTAKLGKADSAFTNNLQQITDIVVPSGSNLQNLNLPIGPNGVVYNSMSRAPIAGATLTMLGAGTPLPAGCFDDPAQQNQITLAAGYYRFDLNFSDPACPSGGRYLIQVTAPGASYVAGESKLIPATSDQATAPFSVPACPGSVNDVLPAVPYCEVQASEFAPPASVSAGAGTKYYLNLGLDGSQVPGSSQIFNNHIPIDPQLAGTVAISKTTPLRNVTVGQLVPYVITVSNLASLQLTGVSVVDRMPPGFTYVKRSALLDGVPTEPTVTGRVLNWNNLTIATNQVRTLKLLLAVGAGVTQGQYVNRAQAVNNPSGTALSGEATATVVVAPDPTFDCTDVFGKVFNDLNRNGVQDEGEPGLAGVRVVTPQGLVAKTDQFGRYHITCAIVPDETRGSNFVLKVDDRSLPSGFRMSTDPIEIKRATSGKALRINFGASIYRVVSIDLSDDAFEPGKTDIRTQWRPRTSLLLDELRKAPSLLRLSYIADTEDRALVEQRMQAFKRQLTEAWDAGKHDYVLSIEPEVFWRRGAPLKRPDVRVPESK
jgi:uncharacterized repeat protein (TIGR01451 family)/fimbrial isopeptide formation D2 family protein